MEKIILFDGSNLNLWKMRETGDAPNWTIEDGVLHVGKRDLVSTVEFGDAHVHVEFRTPDMPGKTGQWKGNSGVYIHGCYEVQVLDSYGIEQPKCDDCGGLYSLYAPLTNACRPALEWQSYDIIIRAPRFNKYGEVAEDPRMTVILNGTVIHNNVILPSVTPGGITENKRVAKGPLMLQDHGDPVQFRNVWVMPLE